MEAQIHEIGRDILEVRPFAGGVGNDESNTLSAQQSNEGLSRKARMPDFDSVTQGPVAIYGEPRPAMHSGLPLAGSGKRLRGIPRQQREEAVQPFLVIAKRWRKLPQNRAQLRLEIE